MYFVLRKAAVAVIAGVTFTLAGTTWSQTPQSPAATVQLVCNHFDSTGESECNYMLKNFVKDKIKKVELQDKDGQVLATMTPQLEYILDDNKRRPSSLFKAERTTDLLPLKFVFFDGANKEVLAPYTPMAGDVAAAVMPLLPVAFAGLGLPRKVPQWANGTNPAKRLTQKVEILCNASERTYWSMQFDLREIDTASPQGKKVYGGYMGYQVNSTTEQKFVFSIWGGDAIHDPAKPVAGLDCKYNEKMEGPTEGVSCIVSNALASKPATEPSCLPGKTVDLIVERIDKPDGFKWIGINKINGNTPTQDDYFWFKGSVGGQDVVTMGVKKGTNKDLRPVATLNFVETYNFYLPKVQSVTRFNRPSSDSASPPSTVAYLYDDAAGFARKQNAYIAGKVLVSVPKVETEGACSLRCRNSGTCDGYTYLAGRKECELKSGRSFVNNPSDDWRSGIKLKRSFSFENNTYSAGRVLRSTPGVTSVPECQLLCEKDAACQSYTYRAREKVCEFKEGTKLVTTEPAAEWRSGVKK